MIQYLLIFLIVGRIAIGLAPILAPREALKLLRFPVEHDNPTARMMGRLFGIRDVGLGVLVYAAMGDPTWLPFVLLFNAAHDVGDAMCISVPLLRRDGIDVAAALSLGFAIGGATLFTLAWWMVS